MTTTSATDTPTNPHRVEWRLEPRGGLYGRFVCDAGTDAACHQYPTCGHETFDCGCPRVEHDKCWLESWFNDAGGLEEFYDGAEEAPVQDATIRDQWDVDGPVWCYDGEKFRGEP